MKFMMPNATPPQDLDETLRVGNVYKCKGGGKTHYWIVVGLPEDRGVCLIGINNRGQVTSTANYGKHVFEGWRDRDGRELLGFCSGIAELDADITWFGAAPL